MKKPKLILLDIDDVLVDLRKAVLEQLGAKPGQVPDDLWHDRKLCDVFGFTYDEFWYNVDEECSDFWAGLPIVPWGKELWEVCNEVARTVLLTSPVDPWGSHGKHQWIKDNFGTRDFLIGPAKWACASPHSLLIDDSDANCEAFEEWGGTAIVFPRIYNKGVGTPNDVISILKGMV